MNIARCEFKFSCSNARLWLRYWEKVRDWTSTLIITKNIQKGWGWGGGGGGFARTVVGICQLHGSKCPFRGRSRNRNLLHRTLEWIIVFFSWAVRDDGEDLSSLLWSIQKARQYQSSWCGIFTFHSYWCYVIDRESFAFLLFPQIIREEKKWCFDFLLVLLHWKCIGFG